MRITFLVLVLGTIALAPAAAQQQNDLWICRGDDGANFDDCGLVVDSAGVPSMAMAPSGRIALSYQWFPAPVQGAHWDSVAVSFSDDLGGTWTEPAPIEVEGMDGWSRPFDPTIVATDDGRWRMYFSSSPGGSFQIDHTTDTYSAISDDGIHYTFEPGARVADSTRTIIDPAVGKWNGLWHYLTPVVFHEDGIPPGTMGALYYTSTDGLAFTLADTLLGSTDHNWTGNFMVADDKLRFYGHGRRSGQWWVEFEEDGSFSDFMAVSPAEGDNPAVLQLPDETYLMTYLVQRHAPTAQRIEAETDEDQAVAFTLLGSDDEGHDLTYSIVSEPVLGSVAISGAVATYTPLSNANGVDRFMYEARDDSSSSGPTEIALTIHPVNDPPVANPVVATTAGSTAVEIALDGADVDNDPLSYSVDQLPSQGTVSIIESTATYVPDDGFEGEDSFSYNVSDGPETSESAAVTITVQNTNTAPVAEAADASTGEDQSVVILLSASDPEGDDLVFEVASEPQHGNVAITGAEASYQPDENFNGDDFFVFVVSDGDLASNPAAVTITVAPVNDPPTSPEISLPAVGASLTLAGDPMVPIDVAWSVSSDVDGDAITYTWKAEDQANPGAIWHEFDAANQSSISFQTGFLARRLSETGVAPGGLLRLFHWVEASDGQLRAAGRKTSLTLVRGAITALEQSTELPNAVVLAPNHPNPFNPTTVLRFGLPEASDVRLTVFDLLGRPVAEVANGSFAAGWHSVGFDATGLATGTYIQRLAAGQSVRVRTLVVVR